MRICVLGPLKVLDDDGRDVEVAGHKLRLLLALLVVNANRVVSIDRIIGDVWAGRPPPAAAGSLHAYISQLRRVIEPRRRPREPARVLVTQAPGYVLRATPEQIDSLCFERLIDRGRTLQVAGSPREAEAALAEALSLWRGAPFSDLGDEPVIGRETARLCELEVMAWQHRIDVWLSLGRYPAAVDELERLLGEHPSRESLWGSLMTALHRAGRRADALRTYERCRAVLDEGTGSAPGPELQALGESIRSDGAVAVERAASAPPPAPAAAGPFVGRHVQLQRLHRRIADARVGRGGVVLVEGEPGIGKTRLVEEVSHEARRRGLRVAWSRCAETAGTPPFWPWVQVLRAIENGGGGDGGNGDAVSPFAEPGDGEGDPAGGDPAAARSHLHRHVTDVLLASARRQPLLVVIDDLHWADASSRHLMQFLAGELVGAPVLVMATFRDRDEATGGLVDLLGSLARQRASERISLDGLSVAEVAQYLDVAAEAPGPPTRLAPALHDRTGGNPLFLIELVRLLTSEQHAGRPPLDDAATPNVPGGVRDVVRRRLAQLPKDTQTLLQVAAVIGRQFDLDVLRVSSALDPDRLLTLVEPALTAGIVEEVPDTWSCRFSHALVGETLYAGLPPMDRARLHRRVGEAIEATRGAGELDFHLDELAHHFFAALPIGTGAKAVDYARRAAARATRSLAHDEAVGHWERAMAALGPDTPDQQRQRHEILLGLGEARRRIGDVNGAREALDEAIGTARSLPDPERAARAAVVFGGVTLWNWRAYGQVDDEMVSLVEELLAQAGVGDPALRVQLLGTLAVELGYRAEEEHRREAYASEAVDLARRLDDAALLGLALNNYYIAVWRPDRERERRAATDEALALAGSGLPRETEVIARLHRMWSLFRNGELDAYETELATCRRLAADVRVPEIAAQVVLGATGLAILAGRWREAEQLSAEAFEQLSVTSVWGAHWCRMVQLVTMRREQGRLGQLLPELLTLCSASGGEPLRPTAVLALACAGRGDEAHARIEQWGAGRLWDWSWDFLTAQWAEVAAILGSPDPQSLYDDLLPLADRLVVAGTGNVSWGSTRAVLGRLARRIGRLDAAAEHLAAAVVANQRLGARPFEARARCDLARLLLDEPQLARGRSAQDIVAPAIVAAREIGMPALLAEAEGLSSG